MSVPSSARNVFWGVDTIIRISGSVAATSGADRTYLAVADIRLEYGYAINREVTTGTNNPYLGTGAFEGTIRLDGLGSSDNRWEDLILLASGQVRDFVVQWVAKDTQITASGRTWTISGVKFGHPFSVGVTRDGAVQFGVNGFYALEPAVSGD